MAEVFQKREIVILDVHNRFDKNNVDEYLASKGYKICQSKIDKRLNVEFINTTVAKEVKEFFDNKELIYNDKQFKFSIKGNRFLIEGIMGGSFHEIKNFFQNYGEVNNVYYTKKYFATLSSIKQAINLVEREKTISINGTKMQIKYAFDRNIGNLNHSNKHFQIKSKEDNRSQVNKPSSNGTSSKLNTNKPGSPTNVIKKNFNSRTVLINVDENKKINQLKKATEASQPAQKSRIVWTSQQTTAKQTNKPVAVNQTAQPSTTAKSSNTQASNESNVQANTERPKRKRERRRSSKNKSSTTSGGSSDTVNQSECDSVSPTKLNPIIKENDDVLLLNGLSSSLPKTFELNDLVVKPKDTIDAKLFVDADKSDEVKSIAPLFAKGPNSTTPFRKNQKPIKQEFSVGAIQNTLDFLDHKNEKFKSIDYFEKDLDVEQPGIIRTYFKKNQDNAVRPPPFVKQFELIGPAEKESLNSSSNVSAVTASNSFQDQPVTPVKDGSASLDETSLYQTPSKSPKNLECSRNKNAFSNKKKQDQCIIS